MKQIRGYNKILSLLSALVFATPLWATEDLYPEIREIDPGLYAAKIPHRDDFGDKDLYCVMEKITSLNTSAWMRYAEVQSNPRATGLVAGRVGDDGKTLQKGSLGDGSAHFRLVLENSDLRNTDVWVAYVTSNPDIKHNDQTGSYRADNLDDVIDLRYGRWKRDPKFAGNSFAKHVQMFMTVTSSKDALVTSHMGIAASFEATILGRTKGISMDLHSFAAKMMLKENPARRFMMNAPMFPMERILYKALPGHVFPFTREKLKEYDADIHRLGEESFYKEKDTVWHLGNIFTDSHRGCAKELMDYAHTYHPRLSYVESHDGGGNVERVFKIFEDDTDRPWLTIDQENHGTYRWLWGRAFIPSGVTHYILVDLKSLADARPIEPMTPPSVGESVSAGAGEGVS